jgi:hypothetical protein
VISAQCPIMRDHLGHLRQRISRSRTCAAGAATARPCGGVLDDGPLHLPNSKAPQGRAAACDDAKAGTLKRPPTEAALRVEGLCGHSEKMTDGARLVRDFQPPLGAVAKPRDGVADHVRACHCSFVPSRSVVRQIDRHLA